MRGPRKIVAVTTLAAALLASCVTTGMGPTTDPIPPRSDAVVIGAFNFSESRVLAEIYRRALEGAGIPAEVIEHVASREIMEPALEQGEVDLVPEYLGTALTFVAGPQEPGGSRDTWRRLRDEFASRGIVALQPAPGQNRNEVVVTRSVATHYSLRKISDLEPIAGDLVFGGPPECPARPLCLQGLESTYGLTFDAFLPLDTGGPMTVAALRGREVDVGLLFTTTPALANGDLVALRDDRRLQPAENIVPVVRRATMARYGPRLREVLDAVSAGLTDHSLQLLNQKAEVQGVPIDQIVTEWLRARSIS